MRIISASRSTLLGSIVVLSTLMAPPAARAIMPPRDGVIPAPLARAAAEGLFALPEQPSGLGTSASQEAWRIPIILISFQDSLLRYTAADFERVLFGPAGTTPTGSFRDYYSWVSDGRIDVQGEVVANVLLPETRAYYSGNSWGLSSLGTPQNTYGAVREALRMAPASINWSKFDLDRDGYVDMLWVIHAGLGGEATRDRDNLWSITTRMTHGWRNGTSYVTDDPIPGSTSQMIRLDRFTMLPELSPFDRVSISEIGVYCHEFGHALGLPDLYDTGGYGSGTVSNVGPGNWSLMSSGAWGTDGASPQYPAHLGAWPLQFLGWDHSLRPTRDTTLVLPPLENGGPIIDWWFQGESSPEHFLIENRQAFGFDRNLPAEGLIVYHVDEALIGQRLRTNSINSGPTPGLVLVEADGDGDLLAGRNRGDENDPFPGASGQQWMNDDTQPGTRTFTNQISQIAVYGIEPVGDAMRLGLQVRAPSWRRPEDLSGPGYKPIDPYGFARVAAVDAAGTGYLVTSELRSGIPQVALRDVSAPGLDPELVSQSGRGAVDPTLAISTQGDLVVAWSDTREGRPQIFVRWRSGGSWSIERRLTELAGDCLNPAVTFLADGSAAIAFQNVVAGQPRIYFLRLASPTAPIGAPYAVTRPEEVPGAPAIISGPGNATYVIWVDRASEPQRLWFAQVYPEANVSPRAALTPPSGYAQGGVSALIDGSGSIHVVWLVNAPAQTQLYYQRRGGPLEVLLEQASAIQNPVLAMDADGALHVVFERAVGSRIQGRYRTWRPERGWDARATDLAWPDAYGVSRPQPLPARGGNLSVAFNAYFEDGPHLMVQRREPMPAGGPPIAQEPSVVVRPPVIGPSPLRAGGDLEIALDGAGVPTAPWVEVYDVGGRHITAVELRARRGHWTGRVDGTVTRGWPSGVYFARVRGRQSAPARVVVLR